MDKRRTDRNGLEIINLMNNYNMTLLNMEEKCEGKFTWSNETTRTKTVIDYVMVNEKMQKHWKEMIIDEEQEITDISDHNMIKIRINKQKTQQKITQKKRKN